VFVAKKAPKNPSVALGAVTVEGGRSSRHSQ
jgi:hypothetical protein